MKLKRLILSEYARNHAGKLDVLGILGGFMPAQLPFQAEYYVVLDLEAEDDDLDKDALVAIVMIDPDGKSLSKVEVSFAVHLQNSLLPRFGFVIKNLATIQSAGTHRVEILCNGERMGEEDVFVQPAENPT